MRYWPVLLLLCAPGALVANCALEQYSNESGPAAPTSTVGPGGGGGAGGGTGGGTGGGECPHETYPDPPDGGTEGGDLDIVLAIREIFVNDEEGNPVGFDLENVCTCQGQGPTCLAPPNGFDCDAPRGIDNNLSSVFPVLALALNVPDLATYYSARAEDGEWSLLMRIRDYNGEANDPQVRLSWYVTNGSMAPPTWQGLDGWAISAASVQAGPDGGLDIDSPTFTDDYAFVNDNTLVASMPQADLTIGGGANRIVFRVKAGGVVAHLEQETGLWYATRSRIFGRLQVDDMFYAISTFRDGSGSAICTGDIFYNQLKSGLCTLPDILAELGSSTTPCNAISVGLGFEAEEARLGEISTPLPTDGGCPDGESPADDTCPTL